jgi:hypothetical protein
MFDYNDPSVLEAIQSKPTRDQKFMKNLLWKLQENMVVKISSC